MGFICPICADDLEKTVIWPKGDKTPVPAIKANVSTTPCGHMFHTYCLRRWMNEGTNGDNCPNCRKPNPKKTSLPVFPNLSEGSGNASVCEETGEEALAEELAKQRRRADEQTSMYREKSQLYDLLSTDFDKANSALMLERQKNAAMYLKYQMAKSFESLLKSEKETVDSLSAELIQYKYVKTMLDSVKIETQREFLESPNKDVMPKTYVGLNHLLRQELAVANSRANQALKDKDSARKSLLTCQLQIQSGNRAYQELLSIKDQLIKKLEVQSAAKTSAELASRATASTSKAAQARLLPEVGKKTTTKRNKRVFDSMDDTIELQSSSESESEVEAKKRTPVTTNSFASPMEISVKSGVPGLSPLCGVKSKNHKPRSFSFKKK